MSLSRHVIVFIIVASSIVGYLTLLELGKRPVAAPPPGPTVPAQR